MWHGERDHGSSDLALEANCVLCLSGQAAEVAYLGVVIDGSDHCDLEYCMQYLWREFHDAPSHSRGALVEAALQRYRVSAERLVRTPFAKSTIPRIATLLLRYGSLNHEQLSELL